MFGPIDHEPIDPSLVREPLRVLYADLDAEVAGHQPACILSGRCCKFAEHGHTLFVSAPEFALLLADAPAPSRPLDAGLTCPWQDFQGRCTAREARPLGCRVYFCDPAYEPYSGPITEGHLAKLRALCDSLNLPWAYAPLHHHLNASADTGRLQESRHSTVDPKDFGMSPMIEGTVREIT